MRETPPPPAARGAAPVKQHLDSWGEIAAYLHRSVSTVQRWEKHEGLPVRRIEHGKLGSVYATTADLDAWYESRRRPAEAAEPADRITLAVLPFQNLSGSSDQDYFSDGLTEELIAFLARLRPERLAVVARTSAMQYRNRAKDVRVIGAELGARYLVEGSVRRGTDRVRVTAQLVAAVDGIHLWADSYEQPVVDVLEIQSAIAERVGESLRIHLLAEPLAGDAPRRQATPEARDEFLKGRYFWHMRTPDAFWRARRHFERAIALDPQFAGAHAGLADTYAVLGFWAYGVLPPRQAFPSARASAEQALRLDPGLAEAHATLGFVQHLFEWDWAAAEASLRRALDLDPSYAIGSQRYALFLALRGRLAEALDEVARARALDPLSLVINHTVAWVHYFARDYERAREHCERTLELSPTFAVTRLLLAAVHSLSGRAQEALAELDASDRLTGARATALTLRACHHARMGERPRAEHCLEELRHRLAAGEASSWHVAMGHACVGRADEAFVALERAVEDRFDMLAFLKVEPHWDPIRMDPRFDDLLRRVGLA
jgi:TolB-like protein/tetratricopeptide (TPR) repeat protein